MQNKALDQGLVVRMKGLEPPSLAALDPKSSASTNFATSAVVINYYNPIYCMINSIFNLLPTGLYQNHSQALKMECKDRYSLYFYKSVKEYFR